MVSGANLNFKILQKIREAFGSPLAEPGRDKLGNFSSLISNDLNAIGSFGIDSQTLHCLF